ncbi:MAG TPA: hypothetical protein VKT78_09260 [Fimbriimonadaceae bacterium]|nr:hypothetical protein [Fimbriimonadaceae bacterium]
MRYCMWSALRAPASCLAQGQAQFELNYSTVDGGSADLLFTARKAGMPVGEYLTTDVAGTIDDGQYWLDNTLYLPPPSTDLFQPRYLDTSGFLLFTQNGEYNVRAESNFTLGPRPLEQLFTPDGGSNRNPSDILRFELGPPPAPTPEPPTTWLGVAGIAPC